MLKSSEIQTEKKIVNHSTRKHLVQKFVENNIPPNEIVQATGHKNVSSINNYFQYLIKNTTTSLPFYPI